MYKRDWPILYRVKTKVCIELAHAPWTGHTVALSVRIQANPQHSKARKEWKTGPVGVCLGDLVIVQLCDEVRIDCN